MKNSIELTAENQEVKGKSNVVVALLKRSDTSVIVATLVLFIVFAIGSSSFLSSYNLFNVFRTTSLYMFVALGQAIVLVIGGMNLSLGAIGGLAVVTAGVAMDTWGLPWWMGIILAIIVGALAGFINGIFIVRFKLNSFVVTLASSFIFTGLVFGISKGYPYTGIPKGFTLMGRDGFLGIPYLFWLMIVTLFVLWYVFKYTVIGRQILATGGNIVAARYSGIKTDRIILLGNVLSGVFAAVAGLLWISRMGSATPATGSDWMIISFAVAVIGGTALSGGAISAIGLGTAALMIALINNGLIMLGANVYFEQSFLGVIIMLAVLAESFRMKLHSSRKR
ncbi:ABC transporter permease [Cohnella terricola]|uniref:ABC transporter permease n=1 Tax=Cohnella terricola TaxID=1289167 RepID=A0A559IVB8_9BACL|nr:ABC transporter permease [Cohnella terricola]TVX91543.1 ABC transporter permease [Cohnella terricola]